MKNYFDVLAKCPLFNEINQTDLPALLNCLGARIVKYHKDAIIFAEGNPSTDLGILLSGSIQITRIDFNGNRSIVATVSPPQMFAEAFACSQISEIPVDVVASDDSEVMLINAVRITNSCSISCNFHHRIILNLLNAIATKTLQINRKLEITSKRTTREKLLTYLQMTSKERNSNVFTIPFDRQELADYLEVDRSGLSAEISKLRKEGFFVCEKNRFELLSKK